MSSQKECSEEQEKECGAEYVGDFSESVASHLADSADSIDADPLTHAKEKWLSGDWEALAAIEAGESSGSNVSAKLAALKASAYLNLDDDKNCKRYLTLALGNGCEYQFISRLLISCVHNGLGKIYALQGDDDRAKLNFETAVTLGTFTGKVGLEAHSRAVSELAKLGLLPKAASLLSKEVGQTNIGQLSSQRAEARLKILESEVELINHQLALSYQKTQLFQGVGFATEGTTESNSGNYVENLRRLSPSQLGQDIWVLEKTDFKRNGFFVEFGATNGILLSNTYLLEREFGWDGICAEPNPKFYRELQKNRTCIVDNACISGVTGEQVEFILAEEYGGISKFACDDSHSDKREAYQSVGNSITLESQSLNDFLTRHGAPKDIDYLSIDTEGSEYDILKSFPFAEWRIKILSIEHNFGPNREKIFNLMTGFGYKRVELEWDDIYYLPTV